ncbi:MAG TPA: hypothetical protein VKT83_03725 [bacterium]|nr:hypothetical protein [bacterium]
MAEDREGVQHVIDGADLYSLIVLPDGDHWQWLVTHVDLDPGRPSYFAEHLSRPGKGQTLAETWAAAEQFLVSHRKKATP